MGQPFFPIILKGGKTLLINEAHVASVDKGPEGEAVIRLSNGDEHISVTPSFDDWEADFLVRKW
jgi:hypothetical protein